MGRWAARADNVRLRQMHAHWLKHLRGPEDPALLRMQLLLDDATEAQQLALEVRSYNLTCQKSLLGTKCLSV